MLSQELRPLSIDKIVGQDEVKKILKAIIRKPNEAPRCYIFQGAFGTGKSSSCRILARELNKLPDTLTDKELLNSKYYYEYDSTVIGNVEEIKKLRDTFSISYNDYWRVVVFDECHAISQQAQTALLKILEESSGKTMFIFATTDSYKLLDTIKSRSLEVEFKTVPIEIIKEHIRQVSSELQLDIDDISLNKIAEHSHGHMRNVHMLIDRYRLLGREDFNSSIKSSVDLYVAFLVASYNGSKDQVLNAINQLLNIPKADLKEDFYIIMNESLKAYHGLGSTYKSINTLVDTFGQDFSIVCQCYFAQWMPNAFNDMAYFQATMLNIYSIIANKVKAKANSQVPVRKENKFGNSIR